MTIGPGDTVWVDRVTHPCAESLRGYVYVVASVSADACLFRCPRCGELPISMDVEVFTEGDTDGTSIPLSWLRKFDAAAGEVARDTAEVAA